MFRCIYLRKRKCVALHINILCMIPLLNILHVIFIICTLNTLLIIRIHNVYITNTYFLDHNISHLVQTYPFKYNIRWTKYRNIITRIITSAVYFNIITPTSNNIMSWTLIMVTDTTMY